MRLVQPFLRVLRYYGESEVVDSLEEIDPDERIPIAQAHVFLQDAIERIGEPDLGLLAAREVSRGDLGAVGYVVSSASTVQEALQVSMRYQGLVNDALDCRLEVIGERAMVYLHSRMPLPRAAADFEVGSFYQHHAHAWPRGILQQCEVCFTHPRPRNTRQYGETFPGAIVRFEAPFCGLVFDRRFLQTPLQTADPKLHDLIRKYADGVLAELPAAHSTSGRVREIISRELAGRSPTAEHVARRLHMSSRTLNRKLQREGTTFKSLVDEIRRQLAVCYVRDRELGLSEVAFLLGFSQTAAFYRAFRRWTGKTPLEYRRAPRV